MASHFSSPTTWSSFTTAWDWKLLGSSSEFLPFSGRQNKKRRRRCTLNKYFTETGACLILGVFVLAALPPWTHCRPTGRTETQTKFNVYAHSSDDSSTGLLPPSAGSVLRDEASVPGRFEFRRKISSSSSSNEPDADSIKNTSSGSISSSSSSNDNVNTSEERRKNVHTFKIIQGSNEDKDNGVAGGNSSMIVHVIVTSSSSSSSGSVELDETDNPHQESGSTHDGDFHYTVAITEDEGEGGLLAEPSSESHVATVKSSLPSAMTTTMIIKAHQGSDDEKESFPHSFHIVDDGTDGQLELKKLPKLQNDTLDIFSAFYRAFSETAQLSTPGIQPLPASASEQDKVSLLPAATTTDGSVTAFKLPPRSDFRQRPSSFQLFQQRRRLHRTRQLLEKRPSTFSPIVTAEQIEGGSNKNFSALGSSSVEETARKLEFLAKKLEKSEQDDSFRGQQDKILAVSSSSLSSLITTTQVPFPPSQQPSSASVSAFTLPKIAVSVTHSKSVVASATATSPPSSTDKKEEAGKQLPKQEAVVVGGVIKNAKSETTFSGSVQEKEQSHGTYSYFTRPRPLIKSLSRNRDSDQQKDNINNKNRSNNHIFPKNFSTHGREGEGNGVPGKIYGGESGAAEGSNTAINGHGEKISTFERSSNNNHNDKINEENIHIQDRHNIIASSKDGGDGTLSPALSKNSPFSSLVEASTGRSNSQRKKITRTVSSEIGDPSSSYFNINVNYGAAAAASPKVAASTPKPAAINWQQPEKNWSEPAQIWSTPSKVWGEPERVWSEPAQVWGVPAKVWTKKLDDEMMQSDQPPEDGKRIIDEDDTRPQGAFVILGDDETEGDSIDGDLGRPLMLHHFTVPPNKQKETVSVSSSVSSSTSSDNKNNIRNAAATVDISPKFLKNTAPSQSSSVYQSHLAQNVAYPSEIQPPSSSINSSVVPNSNSNSDSDSESDSDSDPQNKKTGKKFGYVIEGANVRKYRVEERTPDGYIVGEYGVLNNQNAFLRGVRYTADGTINPRLIHEALMKFLSLRR